MKKNGTGYRLLRKSFSLMPYLCTALVFPSLIFIKTMLWQNQIKIMVINIQREIKHPQHHFININVKRNFLILHFVFCILKYFLSTIPSYNITLNSFLCVCLQDSVSISSITGSIVNLTHIRSIIWVYGRGEKFVAKRISKNVIMQNFYLFLS